MSTHYSIGLMNQLGDALEAEGFTPEQVTKLRTHQVLAGVKKVILGLSEIVDKVVEKLLRLRTSGIQIPATTKTFVSTKKLVVDISLEAKVKISWVDQDIKKWGMDHPVVSRGSYPMACHELAKDATLGDIIKELVSGYETDFAAIFHLISLQPNGDPGELLTNGYPNIFFVDGRAVRVGWNGFGWSVNAREVSDPSGWLAGSQVFSRIS